MERGVVESSNQRLPVAVHIISRAGVLPARGSRSRREQAVPDSIVEYRRGCRIFLSGPVRWHDCLQALLIPEVPQPYDMIRG